MWKSTETARRRSPQLDPLEGRELPSGIFPAPQMDVVAISVGPSVDSSGMAGHVDGAWLDSAPGFGTAWQGPVVATDGRGRDPDATPVHQTGDVWSNWLEPTTVWTHGPMKGAESNDGPAPQTGFPGQVTSVLPSVTITFAPGSAGGGWAFASGDIFATRYPAAPSPSAGTSGSPLSAQPGGYDPGGMTFVARSGAQDPPPNMMNAAPPPMATEFALAKGRLEPFAAAVSFAGPLNATPGPTGPGALAIAPLTANIGTASVVTGSGAQAIPPAVPVTSQLGMATEFGGSVSDGAALGFAFAHRVDMPGTVESGRPAPSAGRAVLATTLSHSSVVRTSAGTDRVSPAQTEAVPTPRGADLIAQSLPFAGDSLERSLDEFVRQLEQVNVGALVDRGPTPIVIATLTVAATAASAVVVRAVVRRSSEPGRGTRIVDSTGRAFALSFPELPRSWSERRR